MVEPIDCYDLVIVGGGMVGASLALALGQSGLRIALLEAKPWHADKQPSYDDRAIALSYGARRIFEGMGLWSSLRERITPILSVHVSDRGHFGFTHLDCRQEGVEALGYVIEGRILGKVLADALTGIPNNQTSLFCPATVTQITWDASKAKVTIQTPSGERCLTARLVVAADGARSQVREWSGIKSSCWEYGQTAIVANVSPEYLSEGMAYERFTDGGPLALLPIVKDRYAVIWTLRTSRAEELMALNDQLFLSALEACFGKRLGCLLRVGKRSAYPLALVHAQEPIRSRLALIGNAAHAIHPVAGQGFNLGLRDVAVLAEVVSEAWSIDQDIGHIDVLKRYAAWRRNDHLRMIALTDGLARFFATPFVPIRLARDATMIMVDLLPPLKRALTRLTMGRVGKLPRLACGLPLRGVP